MSEGLKTEWTEDAKKRVMKAEAKSGNDPDFAKMVQAAADKVIAATAKESKGNGQKEKKK
ncbi:hypothetical protein BKA59DRAFT_540939 [Fusarium tricinctum]|uniref:Uncharacterized protein n=1 Tax=Fusarium tricinctum TaxID=61284 RepID=A0A8K0S6S8_9HYPO|nr:hypothetical protein BKA59DRAFT_540939 [Fusarium tricinctum]